MASGRCGRPALGELAHDGKPNGLRPRLDHLARERAQRGLGRDLRFEEILFLDPALAITGRPVARLPHLAAMSCIQNKRRRISRGSRSEIRLYRAISNSLANSGQCQVLKLAPAGIANIERGRSGGCTAARRHVKAIFNEMKDAYG